MTNLTIPTTGTADIVETAGVVTSTSSGTTVTAGTPIRTKGAWSQIIAATSNRALGILVVIARAQTNSDSPVVDIGVGGAGSETPIINNIMTDFEGIANTCTELFLIEIPSGTRLSARSSNANLAGLTCQVAIYLYEKTASGSISLVPSQNVVESTNVDSISFGFTLTAGSGNVKGSWVQLLGNTSAISKSVTLIMWGGTGGQQFLVDLGTGGSGQETPVISNVLFIVPGSSGATATYFFLTTIPAGQRISARCQSATGSATMRIMAYFTEQTSFSPLIK